VSTWQAVRATKSERVQSRLHQEAQDNLWSAYLSEGRALRFSGLSGRHFDSLEVLSNAAAIRPSLALRNEAIAAMVLRDLRRVVGKDFTKTRQKVSLDPSFQRYALSEPTGGVSIRRVADDTVVGRLPDTGSAAVALSAFSPNGKFLSVGYADGRWRIWDWAAAASAVTLVSVWSVDFTSDSKTVGVSDGTSIVLHDLASGERLRQFSLNGLGSSRAPGALEIDPSGQRLALFCTEAGTNVLILDLRTGQTLATLQHGGFVYHVAWHPDGRRLATGCADKTIHLWDALNGARLRTWPTESCIRVHFDPAGELLASSGWDGYTRLWDFDRGRQLSAILTSGHLWGFDPEGLRLAHGGWDGVVLEFLEVARGQCLRTLYEAADARGGSGGEPVMDASGKLLAFRTQEGIGLWDVPTARPLGSDQLHNGKAVIGFDERSEHLILTGPEGLFRSQITKSEAGAVRNLEKPMLVSAECADSSAGRAGWASADGKICAIVGNDRCQIFRTDTFAKQAETEFQPGMRFGAINANGSMIASGAWHYGGVRVWDAHTGGLIMKLLVEEEDENTATTVAFSPDGRQVVTATPSGYCFWQVGSWSLFLHIPPQPDGMPLSRMAFSRDGKLFAGSHAGNKIRLHSAATGEVLANLEAPDSRTITGLVFSADGCQLFASESADALRVWDLRLIRRQLAEINLDWNLPPYPAKLSASQ
jgi:WD40 repeat protein